MSQKKFGDLCPLCGGEKERGTTKFPAELGSGARLARKPGAPESKYDAPFKVVFEAIRELMTPPTSKRRKIGFLVQETAATYARH